jgi:hypothetical protein
MPALSDAEISSADAALDDADALRGGGGAGGRPPAAAAATADDDGSWSSSGRHIILFERHKKI